jgi:hypothetical protein
MIREQPSRNRAAGSAALIDRGLKRVVHCVEQSQVQSARRGDARRQQQFVGSARAVGHLQRLGDGDLFEGVGGHGQRATERVDDAQRGQPRGARAQ